MRQSDVEAGIRRYLETKDIQPKMSINERSLQLFGDEKYLASGECQSYLSRHHLSMDIFNVYKSLEPFLYFDTGIPSADVLIVENKDTWYTMRKIMTDIGTICGIKPAAIIYGEGRKIQSSFSYIAAPEFEKFNGIKSFYYFGDLDASGIDILYKLQRTYKDNIVPFEPGYQYLYDHRACGRTKDMQRHIPISMSEVRVLDFLGADAITDIYTFCNHDYLVPQELLNYEVLSNWDWLYS